MKKYFYLLSICICFIGSGYAQKNSNSVPDSILSNMKWRNIGPFRAGRSLAVAGSYKNNMTYYFGATGGGVWKSTNGGMDWFPISDSTFKSSSVGAVAVAPSDENVVYVGMGEADMRSNISFGDGMYKSTDAGKTWKQMGPLAADAIANIEVVNSHARFGRRVHVLSHGSGVHQSITGVRLWMAAGQVN